MPDDKPILRVGIEFGKTQLDIARSDAASTPRETRDDSADRPTHRELSAQRQKTQ